MARRWVKGQGTESGLLGAPREAAVAPGSLGGDGHCLLFQPLESPLLTLPAPVDLPTGHQPELVVVSMSLPEARKKKTKL